MLSVGAVTGIAIGGVNGFDPLDGDSQVVIEVEDANVPAGPNNNGAGPNNGGGNAADTDAADAADTEDAATPTPDETSAVDDDTATPDTATPDTSTQNTATQNTATPGTPKTTGSVGRATPADVTDTTVATTPPPVEAGPSQAELDAATAFDAAFLECVSLLEMYPDVEEFFLEGCFVDPWGTIGAIEVYLAEIHAAEEAVGAAIDNCLWALESYPALVELDPALVEDCHQDPDGTAVVIAQLADEMAANAEIAGLVDDCSAQLDLFPELIEIDPNLVGRCSTDPASALTTIYELLDVAG